MSDRKKSSLISVRLTAIRYAARDTNLYELSRPDGGTLPAAEPGAHIDLHLPNGIVRQYSLTLPSPAPTHYALAIKRDPASLGGSRYIFDQLKVGALLNISAPVNNFPLDKAATHSILIAGGIGVTPIWAMAQELQAGTSSWQLYCACRSSVDMAFLDEINETAAAKFHFDDEANGAFLDIKAIVNQAPKHAHLYCCGPTPMLKAFEDATKNWPSEQVHVEYFTSKEEANLKGGYVVTLARSGRQFQIPPGKSILAVLRDAGIDVPYSCEDGVCGSCETTVISGVPDHRDSVLNKQERAANKTMMICCSGCRGQRLLLDL